MGLGHSSLNGQSVDQMLYSIAQYFATRGMTVSNVYETIFDKNADSMVSYPEFEQGVLVCLQNYQGQTPAGLTSAAIRSIFDRFDANHDGRIDLREFEAAFSHAGGSSASSSDRCPIGHQLQEHATAFAWGCSRCGRNSGAGVPAFSCHACAFSVCGSCLNPLGTARPLAAAPANYGAATAYGAPATVYSAPQAVAVPYNIGAAAYEEPRRLEGSADGMGGGGAASLQAAREKRATDVIARFSVAVLRAGHSPADVFKRVDKDGNGSLSQFELEDVILRFQPDLSQTERNLIFKRFDSDNSGHVDFAEWCRVCNGAQPSSLNYVQDKIRHLGDKLKQMNQTQDTAWRLFDTSNVGSLSTDEWRNAVRYLCPELAVNDAEAMFAYFDSNRDGRLSIPEFVRFFTEASQRLAPQSVADPATGLPMHYSFAPEQAWQVEILDAVRNGLGAGRVGLQVEDIFQRLHMASPTGLSRQEFGGIVRAFVQRQDLAESHIDTLFDIVNYSKSGHINLAEFRRRLG